ncbi:MAG: PEP-CTERM sorting domain-containing protein [candidate division Zixibacteria bacterium]
MKTKLTILMTLFLMLAGTIGSQAAIYTFQPSPADLWDLSHDQAYTWGISWDFPEEQIIEAKLTFFDIYNWKSEDNWLYIHMLDNPPVGTFALSDPISNSSGTDYFANEGILIDIWSDPNGGPPGIDLTYSFSDIGILDDFIAYSSDGIFGFAIDADCHYFNREIQLTVFTSASVPEPSTVILIGLGLAGFGFYRRFK